MTVGDRVRYDAEWDGEPLFGVIESFGWNGAVNVKLDPESTRRNGLSYIVATPNQVERVTDLSMTVD